MPDTTTPSDRPLLAASGRWPRAGQDADALIMIDWFYRSTTPVCASGQFEYAAELFAERFADLVGGREVMDRWMKTPAEALGGRSPEEALRLGMTQSVIENILQFSKR